MQIVTAFPFGSRLGVGFGYAGGCGLGLALIIAHPQALRKVHASYYLDAVKKLLACAILPPK
jgi:hypothetical protein